VSGSNREPKVPMPRRRLAAFARSHESRGSGAEAAQGHEQLKLRTNGGLASGS